MNRTPIINIILIMIAIVEIWGIFQVWSMQDNTNTDKISETKSSSKALQFDTIQVFEKKNTPLATYDTIVKYNLFSPKREEFIKEVIEPEPELEPETKKDEVVEELSADKMILYGVIIMGDYRKALVSNMDTKKNSGQIWLTQGDVLDDFVVTAIEKDKIIVTSDKKQYSVLLYDVDKPKKRNITKQIAVKQKVLNQPPKILAPEPEAADSGSEPATEIEKEASDEDYEIISTPFGDFKRKKQK